MTGGAPTLGGIRRFNTVTVQNLTVTGTLTASSTEAITGATTITAANANALTVGPNGATNPTLKISTNTTSAATGISVVSAAAASGVAIAAISSGTDENLTINAKGAGTVSINGTATGGITLARAVTLSSTLTGGSSSDIAINTNKFTVAASSGNTVVGGTLGVTGAATAASISTTGTHIANSGTAVPASADAIAAGAPITMFSTGIKLWVTSDTPSFSATKGDLCINTGGSSSSTRLYINNGTTNWVAITTAS